MLDGVDKELTNSTTLPRVLIPSYIHRRYIDVFIARSGVPRSLLLSLIIRPIGPALLCHRSNAILYNDVTHSTYKFIRYKIPKYMYCALIPISGIELCWRLQRCYYYSIYY